jgi:hypothetical protein
VQLRFPILEGISSTEAYRAATVRGVAPEETPESEGLELRCPDALHLFLHPTPAGSVPVLVAPEREDFVALVQALAMRNEPEPVPASMGATTIAGLVNWDRVAVIRRQWESEHPHSGPEDWSEEMARVRSRKELYQDCLILLSTGPYSGIPADAMGMAYDEWLRLSLRIRIEHEATHYLTRRLFGSMRNNAFDEIIADYVGITSAVGSYRSDWLLRFLGLEGWPDNEAGGRIENYRGEPPLSDSAFRVLQALAHDAALALARHPVASFRPGDFQSQGEVMLRLTALALPELATMA